MRAFVFTDPSLTSQAGRFVWLALDTEKAANAAIRKKLQVVALPSYFVLDPADARVALRWVGGASVAQLTRILDDGRAAVASGTSPSGRRRGPASPADRALLRADSLYGQADYAGAAAAYDEALRRAPADWPPYGRAVESLLFALQQTKGYERGAGLALEAWPRLGRTASAANLAASGLDCALNLPKDHARRQTLADTLERIARVVADDRALPLAADDRSGVYIALYAAREAAGDSIGARRVAAEWAAFLEGEAARATTPDARAVFDSHRLAAYLELGQPERAVPMLENSERDLPGDYNPPARLATALRALKRWPEALAASDRALTKAYGPRRVLLLQTRTDIYLGMADSTAARRTLEEAVAFAGSLPPGQRSENAIAALRKRLEGLR